MDYKQAKKLFDSVTPWRNSYDRPWDNRKHSHKRMRMKTDGSIEFDYNGGTFVTHHPNGQVTMHGYSNTQHQNIFMDMLPPAMIYNEGNRVGAAVLTCPMSQFRPEKRWYRFPMWVSKESNSWTIQGDKDGTNPDVLVYRCDKPVTFDYCAVDQRWKPVSEPDLTPFQWAEIDRKAARKVSEEYKLGDFQAYLKAITTLQADALAPYVEASDEVLLDLIKAGDFAQAMKHFPRGEGGRYSRWRRQFNKADEPPTWSYFGTLRTMIYKERGCLVERSEQVVNLPEYKRIQSLLYRFQ